MKYTRCLECGELLEATVPCYLSDVEVDQDGFIVNYRVAFQDNYDQRPANTPLGDALNLDEPADLRIYCPNDHPFDLEAAKTEKTTAR